MYIYIHKLFRVWAAPQPQVGGRGARLRWGRLCWGSGGGDTLKGTVYIKGETNRQQQSTRLHGLNELCHVLRPLVNNNMFYSTVFFVRNF